MKVIIAGAGAVGFHLARLLSSESEDVVLIDTAKDRLEYAENFMDVLTIHGTSTSYKILKEAGVNKADLLIAVTYSEDTNLATAIIGKKLGAQKTIARIRNTEFLEDQKTFDLNQLGIDEIISPESLAAREIRRLVRETAVTDSFDFEEGKLSLIGLQINKNAPVIKKSLKETAHLNADHSFINVAINRNGKTIIPKGDTTFHINDHAYFIIRPEGLEQLFKFAGKKKFGIRNVMILGGSRTGIHASKILGKRYNVKLIEKDKQKCYQLADQLHDTLVIHGDATNVELLHQEGIRQMDAFIAVTGNSETNIISSLVAKNHGVPKTIALVENVEYINLSQSIGVDTLINKKLIAANFIFRYIRKGNIISLTGIHGMDAEILEFKVNEGTRITQKPIKALNFPKSMIIGGVIRNGTGYITFGDFRIQPNDRVVVFSPSHLIHKVEKFFK